MSAKKSDVELFFRCVYCGYDTRMVVKLAPARSTSGNTIQIVRYCEHCNRPNKLEVRDNLDVHPMILGHDPDVVDSQQGMPVIQGKKML